jgi:hypothetical protein
MTSLFSFSETDKKLHELVPCTSAIPETFRLLAFDRVVKRRRQFP